MKSEELVILEEETEAIETTDDLLKEIEDKLEEAVNLETVEDTEVKSAVEDIDLFGDEEEPLDLEAELAKDTEELDLEEMSIEDDLKVEEIGEQDNEIEAVEETELPSVEELGKLDGGTLGEPPLQLFEESEIVTPKLDLTKKQDKKEVLVETKPQQEKGTSLIHSIMESLVDKTMDDADFESLCKLKKFTPKSVEKRGSDVGLDKRLILYGLINKSMNTPYEKEQGVYEKQGLGVIEELVNRLQINQPALSEQEYEEFCIFLGVQKSTIDARANGLWLNRELVLLGVLKLSIKGA